MYVASNHAEEKKTIALELANWTGEHWGDLLEIVRLC